MDLTTRLVQARVKPVRIDRAGNALFVWVDGDVPAYSTLDRRLAKVGLVCLGHGLRLDDDGQYRSYVRVTEG